MVSVRSADCDLVAHLKAVEIICEHSALLDAEFLIFFISRRRSNRKHTFADSRSAEHRALSRHMLEELAALRSIDTECLNIRRLLADVSDHAYFRDQGIQCIVLVTCTFTHYFSPPCFANALITFTIFNDSGHFSTHLPHPTQEYIPSLFAGKYTSLCMNLWRNLSFCDLRLLPCAIIVKSEYIQESQQRYLCTPFFPAS